MLSLRPQPDRQTIHQKDETRTQTVKPASQKLARQQTPTKNQKRAQRPPKGEGSTAKMCRQVYPILTILL
jgi:hypothetical protein